MSSLVLSVFHQLSTAECGAASQDRASKTQASEAQGLGLEINGRRT